jgi:hypothetical protein
VRRIVLASIPASFAHVAIQRRALTKAIVQEAVERYFEALAEDITSAEWVDLPGIGKIPVIQEEANSILTSFGKDGKLVKRLVIYRLRTKIRLHQRLTEQCRTQTILSKPFLFPIFW